jgi:DNA invertase Pin-like site-specific DNA recombinase
MRVRIIEPLQKVQNIKKKACAYARVSTDQDKQEESLQNQINYYKNLISNNPEYEYLGVFADRGITGTTGNRPEFQRMLELCREGRIDLIITKSISRFARNTAIVLETVRELKDIGVEVIFEKENIRTLSGDGELMLTVLSSFAQEESKNVSDNIKWRIKKEFERGIYHLNTNRFLGYDKDEFGNLVINLEEAEIVKNIFEWYVSGTGCSEIARKLTGNGIKTITGLDEWNPGTILGILKNEKYKGDVILQKTYVPDHIRKKAVENRGEVDRYYLREDHPPIVSEEIWEKVQEIMDENKYRKGITNDLKYNNKYPYTGLLFCSKCGSTLRRRVWNSKTPFKKYVWQCSNYVTKSKRTCTGTKIDEKELERVDIDGPTIIREELRDGKKYYSYTSKGK